MVVTEDTSSNYIEDLPDGETRPGVTSSRAFKEDDTTTTVTTTLIPIKGLLEGDDSSIAQLKEMGFPGFEFVSPDSESTKPCTITTNSSKMEMK